MRIQVRASPAAPEMPDRPARARAAPILHIGTPHRLAASAPGLAADSANPCTASVDHLKLARLDHQPARFCPL